MTYPVQTPQDMERETLGNIARLCCNMEKYAMERDLKALISINLSLQTQIHCLEIFHKCIQRTPKNQ